MHMSTLTVYLDGSFWVAVLERSGEDGVQAARVVLGSEPSDAELFVLLRDHYDRFVFGPLVTNPDLKLVPRPRLNGKRAQREARKEAIQGPGTRAQRALSATREASHAAAKADSKERREEEEARKRSLKARQRKEKHRGH